MKKEHVLRALSSLAVAFIVFLASCSKSTDQILSATDTQSVNSESASSSYTDEGTNISSNAISGIPNTTLGGGRTLLNITGLGDKDERLKCAMVTFTFTGTKPAPAGTIKLDFGTGCTDNENVTRKGQIIINFSGKKWMAGSYVVTRFIDYYRNAVHIEGTDSVGVVSGDSTQLTVNSTLTGGKVTFADGKFITRTHSLTRQWVRDFTTPLNSQFINKAGGTASGANKAGKNYTMTITNDLIVKVSCLAAKIFIPVSGTKSIAVDGGNTYTIDFGDGTCDNLVTVSVNGKSKTITVDPDGN